MRVEVKCGAIVAVGVAGIAVLGLSEDGARPVVRDDIAVNGATEWWESVVAQVPKLKECAATPGVYLVNVESTYDEDDVTHHRALTYADKLYPEAARLEWHPRSPNN